jgi:hypothetical protein
MQLLTTLLNHGKLLQARLLIEKFKTLNLVVLHAAMHYAPRFVASVLLKVKLSPSSPKSFLFNEVMGTAIRMGYACVVDALGPAMQNPATMIHLGVKMNDIATLCRCIEHPRAVLNAELLDYALNNATLFQMVKEHTPNGVQELLYRAARLGRVKTVEDLLSDPRFYADALSMNTAIQEAIFGIGYDSPAKIRVIQMLLEDERTDPNWNNYEAIMLATRCGFIETRLEVVRTFLACPRFRLSGAVYDRLIDRAQNNEAMVKFLRRNVLNITRYAK